MRRHKHLFERICEFENLLVAARKAQRGKRARSDVALFNHRLESELLLIRRELLDRTYRPGRPRQFEIHDPKPRVITAAPYRDRVVHHALCNVIEPIFDAGFIGDSYACRKGKGTHAAVDRLTRAMRRNRYALQCDIRAYFPSIDHDILRDLIHRKIGCADTLWLVDLNLPSSPEQQVPVSYCPGDDLLTPVERRVGLPIENQTSQFFGNVYLDPLDHLVKERLRVRDYVRYCDDFILLATEKTLLWEAKSRIEEFLSGELRLALHPTKQWVRPMETGLDFLGYRVFPDHRRLLRRSGYRFQRRLRGMGLDYASGRVEPSDVRQRIAAWLGHAAHADTYGLRSALLGRAVFSRVAAR